MPKMSIYVPDEMKARIDEAGDRANWSGIAQRAFGIELNHLESIKEIGSMTDVIERLRASKEKYVEHSLEDGRESGRVWAMRVGEYGEIKRVAALNADLLRKIYQEPDTAVLMIVTEAIVGDRGEARDILRRASDTAELFSLDEDMIGTTLTQEWLAAFVEGVQAVWDEIADQI